jgi:AraC-like DNA-binding protein
MRTIDAVWIKLAVKKLERKGLSATALLREAEVRPHVLSQKAARVPFHQHAALLDLAAKATQNGCFGLELAANEGDFRDNGLVAYTALSSGNLGEALRVLERYIHVFNEAIDVSVAFLPREVKIVFDPSDAGLATTRQAMEFGAANFVRGIRCLTNTRLRPLEVKFRHARSRDIAKLEKFFGCPVHFGARHNSLTISRSHLVLPIATADERLHAVLTGYCEEILTSRVDTSPDLRHRVETIIAKLLHRGEAETKAVAQELGMSVRTLARRLGELGVTFARILDELRQDLAVRYLRDPDLGLSQIAFLLGYSEPSAFSHAFRRWTRTTPGEWRTKQAGTPAHPVSPQNHPATAGPVGRPGGTFR